MTTNNRKTMLKRRMKQKKINSKDDIEIINGILLRHSNEQTRGTYKTTCLQEKWEKMADAHVIHKKPKHIVSLK